MDVHYTLVIINKNQQTFDRDFYCHKVADLPFENKRVTKHESEISALFFLARYLRNFRIKI